jgi:hypothetical protein
MKKTPHYWAVVLVHERMTYGSILAEQPDVLLTLKKELFKAAKEIITEAIDEALYKEPPYEPTDDPLQREQMKGEENSA